MIKLGVKMDAKKVVRALNKIHSVDIPMSTFYARRTGVRKAMTDSRRAVISSLDRKVPLKYLPIKRPGQRNTNARFIGYFGDKNKEKAWIKFNSNHINPAGTNKYPNVAKATKRTTKTGKKTRRRLKVRGIGGVYNDAFLIKSRRGAKASPQVFTREGGRLEQVKIELGPKAEAVFHNAAGSSFAKAYEKELSRQMKKRIRKRGTR